MPAVSLANRSAAKTEGVCWNGARNGTVELDEAKLRAAMDCKGVTAREVAHAAGVAEYTVGRALRGMPLTRRKAAAIIRALITMPDVQGMSDFLRQ